MGILRTSVTAEAMGLEDIPFGRLSLSLSLSVSLSLCLSLFFSCALASRFFSLFTHSER